MAEEKVSEEEVIVNVTRGKQTTSFRVVIPAKIVKKAGFREEEQFTVLYRIEKDILELRRITYDEMLED